MKLRNVLAAVSFSLVLSSVPVKAHAFDMQSLINWCSDVLFTSRTGTKTPDPKDENNG
ncbi:MAG: hypothetical protein GJ680_14665 [Alteromonadaceae bacterium]|nr:hypothetical protein [Alteromonadaceae bacterium]